METIGDIGEKRLIAEFIRPLFNPEADPYAVGDDCAVMAVPFGHVILASTDRVPSDLIALRLGLIDYHGFGRYLATLNISDIAASGGNAIALLLNLGLPVHFGLNDLLALCGGVRAVADEYGARVMGGDMSSSAELSCSATAIGSVPPSQLLLRRGAAVGDTVFASRPLGLTPAAFAHHLIAPPLALSPQELTVLSSQFSALGPMIALGRELATSGLCTSCMDNTDGVAQTLAELGEASGVGCLIQARSLRIPDLVRKCAEARGMPPVELALSAGADFSLIGTLRGSWTQAEIDQRFQDRLSILGSTQAERGVWLEAEGRKRRIRPRGWNYFNRSEHDVLPLDRASQDEA